MSEEFASEYKYKDEDIVWVKLGPSWWPGEVRDLETLPREVLDFKKPPLVIVKFFDEDSYEYVKTRSSIYPYNCEKKNEFIKKGMGMYMCAILDESYLKVRLLAGFRTKQPHMEKFPKDVTTAEVKTGGNPNILSDPIFIPEKKSNIIAEIFGTPSPKGKGLKDKKQRTPLKQTRDTAYITHRRFLGADDYKAYICVQFPGKDRTFGDSEDEEVVRINNEPEQEFTCHSCTFTTRRLEVLVLHTKSHIQGDYVPGVRRPKRPVAIRKKKEKTRKKYLKDATTETDSNSSDNDVLHPPQQKKRKTKTTKTKKSDITGKDKSSEKSGVSLDGNNTKQKTDIRSDLLAEWDLSEDEMYTTNDESIQNHTAGDDSIIDQSLADTGKEDSTTVLDDTMNDVTSQEADAKERVDADGDCVTIEDDIVPVADDIVTVGEDTVTVGDDIVTVGDDIVTVGDDIVTGEDEIQPDSIEKEAKPNSESKMDKETQEAIKSCFDFDEDDEDEHSLIISTAAASGRKIPRVIPPTEKRRSDDDLFVQEEEVHAMDKEAILKVSESFNRKSEGISDEIDATFKELMDETAVPELPEVRNALKCEQNFHCVKTIKFPDKPEKTGSSSKRKKQDVGDQKTRESSRISKKEQLSFSEKNEPTKLINPKKRFAKSFEDFEKELRKKDQQDSSTKKRKKVLNRDSYNQKKTDTKIEDESIFDSTETISTDFFEQTSSSCSEIELKTEILSRIVEEANINEESKIKIMSKMQKKHRTPRNKILESYLNTKSKEKLPQVMEGTKQIMNPVLVPDKETKEILEDTAIQIKNPVIVEAPIQEFQETLLEETSGDGDIPKQIIESSIEEIRDKEEESILQEKSSEFKGTESETVEPQLKKVLEDITQESVATEHIDPIITEEPNDEILETMPKETTQHRDFSKHAAIVESSNDEMKETLGKIDKQVKSSGIPKTKKKSRRGNYSKKQRHHISKINDDDQNSKHFGIREDVPGSSESEKVDTLDSMHKNENHLDTEHTEDRCDDGRLENIVDGRLKGNAIELQNNEETSDIINGDANERVLDDSMIDLTINPADTDSSSQKEVESRFEETIEITGNENAEDICLSESNHQDISISHIDAADHAEIQDVVSEIVNQLEVEETCGTLKDNNSQSTETDVQEEILKEDFPETANRNGTSAVEIINQSEVKQSEVQTDNEVVDAEVRIDKVAGLENNKICQQKVEDLANENIERQSQIKDSVEHVLSSGKPEGSANKMAENHSSNINICSLNESDEIINYGETKNSKLQEDDSLAFVSLSQTEREDFSPIGLASLHLPEDAILQPKKSKKRKHSRHKSSSKKRKHSKDTESVQEQLQHLDTSHLNTITEKQLPTEIVSGKTVEAEQFVCGIKDDVNFIVSKETIYTEEIVVDDRLARVSQDPILEALVTDEIVDENLSNIGPFDQDHTTVPKVANVQSDIECIEIINEEIVLTNNIEETTDNMDKTIDSDIKKDGEEQFQSNISATIEISEKHVGIKNFGDFSETVEVSNELHHDEVQLHQQDAISEEYHEIKVHHSLSNKEVFEELHSDNLPNPLLGPNDNVHSDDSENLQTEKEAVSLDTHMSHTLDANNIEIDTIQDLEIQIVNEPIDVAVEQIVEETNESPKPAVEEANCKITPDDIEDINMRGETGEEIGVQKRQEDNNVIDEQVVGEAVDASECSDELQDETQGVIEHQTTGEVTDKVKEYGLDNSENVTIQDESTDVLTDQKELCEREPKNLEANTRVDTEPSLMKSVKHVDTELVSKNEQLTDDSSPVESEVHNNQVEILCANNENDFLKFSIQTNLSNLSIREELSALALTSLAELKSGFDSDSNTSSESPAKKDIVISEKISEPELVAIEANLTVVSEKDLADGQVEITTEKVISSKKTSALSHFSVDFSDSTNDSSSTIDTCGTPKSIDFESKGTEFTSRAITKELRHKSDTKKSNTYEQYELLDILEGNSDFDKKAEIKIRGKAFAEDICDFEEHIPSQIVCSTKFKQDIDDIKDEMKKKDSSCKSSIMSTTSKLMERLTEEKSSDQSSTTMAKDKPIDNIIVTPQDVISNTVGQLCRKNLQNITKLKVKPILPEQIIRTTGNKSTKLPEKPQQNVMDDIEDVEAFVIHKDLKKHIEEVEPNIISPPKAAKKSARSRGAGKAKILQQTIITPTGEIIQPASSKTKKSTVKPILGKPAVVKSSVVDVPSVSPCIVSSSGKSHVLIKNPAASTTTASLMTIKPATISTTQDDNIFDINSMPIVLSDQILTPESIENMPIVIGEEVSTVRKTEAPTKMVVKQTVTPKMPTKVTTVSMSPAVATKTVTTTKSTRPRILQSVTSKSVKVPTSSVLSSSAKSGKYILVPQGSVASSQLQSVNKKTVVKRSLPSGSPNVSSEPTGNKIMIVTNQQGQQQRLLLTPAQQKMLGYQNPGQKFAKAVVKGNLLPKAMMSPKAVPPLELSKSTPVVSQKASVSPTLVPFASQTTVPGKSIKQPVTKKMPSPAQKVSGGKVPKTILITTKHGQTVKKITTTEDDIEKQVAAQLEAIKASAGMKFGHSKMAQKPPAKRPPPKKVEPKQRPEAVSTPPPLVAKKRPPLAEEPPKPDRPLNQLVIQDALGNQTTITEGQILALPNETIGGQPHSYVLVTLDHSGNLTPLNNEALMSLDPNLGLGGDLSNMVLQIDQGALSSGVEHPLPLAQAATVKLSNPGETLQAGTSKIEIPVNNASVSIPMMGGDFQERQLVDGEPAPAEPAAAVRTIVPSADGEPGRQLIVTGDPAATRKFLETLTEGAADLANIIANAEGKSILIQTGDQQILINATSDGHPLALPEPLEGATGGNPLFASKSTDILAAALADTDVFAPQKLYPMHGGHVSETSLTLGAPIMTPLEVPSTNAKKLEVDVLTQVPSNVDLPITVTDPNISQTVANQQVLVNELQSTLELGLSGAPAATSGSVYQFSLAGLDDAVDHLGRHKPFNGSMPLLNDDAEEAAASVAAAARHTSRGGRRHDGSFLEVESRFTLGGEMCSSLSEPPPEMFDISEVNSFMDKPLSLHSTPDPESKDEDATDSNEGSCEIPVQPKIVTKLSHEFDGAL